MEAAARHALHLFRHPLPPQPFYSYPCPCPSQVYVLSSGKYAELGPAEKLSEPKLDSCVITLQNGCMPITGGLGPVEKMEMGSYGPTACSRECVLPLTDGQANMSCLKVGVQVALCTSLPLYLFGAWVSMSCLKLGALPAPCTGLRQGWLACSWRAWDSLLRWGEKGSDPGV